MKFKKHTGIILAGIGAGAVNGLFGAGGGMVLVPLLSLLTKLDDQEIFPASVSIILPICLISLFLSHPTKDISTAALITYMVASAIGGILAGIVGNKIPTIWLHRLLGVLILWGGIRYLW